MHPDRPEGPRLSRRKKQGKARSPEAVRHWHRKNRFQRTYRKRGAAAEPGPVENLVDFPPDFPLAKSTIEDIHLPLTGSMHFNFKHYIV